MANVKKEKYNVSINSQGYILSGIPLSPARIMRESSVFGTYPTQVDLEFKDSSQFLPWCQTDFSGGFQDEKWTDNAKFKKGTGLEYIAKYGELTLLNDKSATLKDFGSGFTFGAVVEYDRDSVGLVMGVTKGSGTSQLWKMNTSDSFTQITGGTWANVDAVHDADELQGKAYVGLTVSAGNPLKTYDGSAVADITLTNALSSSLVVRMVKRIKTRLYVGGYTQTAANGDALAYSDDEGTTWTNIITKTGKNRQITQGIDNFGTLYFLIEDGSRTELWWCNDTIVTQIYRWDNLVSPKIKSWLGKVYIEGEENGKLMRFEWNGATLKTVFEEKISGKMGAASATTANHLIDTTLSQFVATDVGKVVWNTTDNTYANITVFTSSSDVTLDTNIMASSEKYIILELDLSPSTSVIYKNNLHSYGLVYDGLFHFPSWIFKYTANKIKPIAVFGNGSTQVPYFQGLSGTNLIITKLNTAAYLTTGNVITGIFNGGKPAVNKLWHSVTVSFKALVTGQTIVVAYSADDEATWTTIDTISPTTGEIEKTLYLPNDITSKRIQIRLTLTGGGTNTPTLYDFIMRFLPLPDNRFEWALKLNCSNNLMLLDGKSQEPKRASELRNLLERARFKNEIVAFQDTDFAETLINDATDITAADTTITVDSTADFPEQGRVKIDQEEILYTGKSATTFTGCTRGERGTKAVLHLDDATVNNAYNVIISSVSEQNTVSPEAKSLESEVSILLKEV